MLRCGPSHLSILCRLYSPAAIPFIISRDESVTHMQLLLGLYYCTFLCSRLPVSSLYMAMSLIDVGVYISRGDHCRL
jgi:hypothetical protein